MSTTLDFLDEGAGRRSWPLGAGATRVGRSPENDLVIPEPAVSAFHLVLQLDSDGLRVRDLGSTNGTFVNEHPVAGVVELRDGDLLRVGLHVRARVRVQLPARGAPRWWLFHQNTGRTCVFSGEAVLEALLDLLPEPPPDAQLDEDDPPLELPGPHHLRVQADRVWLRSPAGEPVAHRVGALFQVGVHRVAVLDAGAAEVRTVSDGAGGRWTLRIALSGRAGPVAQVLDPDGAVLGELRAANRVAVLHLLAARLDQDLAAGVPEADRGWCPDEELMRGVWGRSWSQKGPASFQVLVHRIRKDLAHAGLSGALIEKRAGLSRLRPGSVQVLCAGEP
jgi:hypothetical protein